MFHEGKSVQERGRADFGLHYQSTHVQSFAESFDDPTYNEHGEADSTGLKCCTQAKYSGTDSDADRSSQDVSQAACEERRDGGWDQNR